MPPKKARRETMAGATKRMNKLLDKFDAGRKKPPKAGKNSNRKR